MGRAWRLHRRGESVTTHLFKDSSFPLFLRCLNPREVETACPLEKQENCIKYNNQRDAGEWEQEGLRLQRAKNHKAERVSCSYFELWCLFANTVNKEEAESPGSASTENCRQRSEKHEKLWQANNLKANVVSFHTLLSNERKGADAGYNVDKIRKHYAQWKKPNMKVFNTHIKYYIKFST